jgi:hypothetical protein
MKVAKGKSKNSPKQRGVPLASPVPQPASTSKRNTSPSKVDRPSSALKQTSSSAERAISDEEIGHVAGDVWGLLNQDDGQTLAAIKKSINAPADLTLAAIGWLAREGKLTFSQSGRSVTISLR